MLFRSGSEYKCPVHKIYVSQTTFAYERETDNILWSDQDSLQLLLASKRADRDERLSLETSERALTWNVFRWLESAGALGALVEHWTGRETVHPQVVYWGYSREREGTHGGLLRARSAFSDEAGETEPAVLLETEQTLFFIDPRVGSAKPAPRAPAGYEGYETGGGGWAHQVLEGPCRDHAADRGRFDLLRLWLLGTWMAEHAGKGFVLVHLIPSWLPPSVLEACRPRFKQTAERAVVHTTWEELYTFVRAGFAGLPGAPALMTYLEEKSAGYNPVGILRRAFALQPRMTGSDGGGGQAPAPRAVPIRA